MDERLTGGVMKTISGNHVNEKTCVSLRGNPQGFAKQSILRSSVEINANSNKCIIILRPSFINIAGIFLILLLSGCGMFRPTLSGRLNEAKNNGKIPEMFYGLYAGSTQPADIFVKRLEEIDSAGTVAFIYHGWYAASKDGLKQFEKRIAEAETAGALDPQYFGAYAGSSWTMQEFIERVTSAESDGRIPAPDRVYFAASYYSIDEFTARYTKLAQEGKCPKQYVGACAAGVWEW